ncbi:hypothetical protein I4U23_004219 [Adineta vaga]|nr:hypothetical protein I4U23_004219 [Adineta vaga]
MVDEHITEMQRQLAATNSIFAWTQAYNKYMAFFIRNFGSPAKVYGRGHIDGVIDAIARIHRTLFSNTKGNLIETVAPILTEKFGVNEIPVGWYVWPTAAGGLQIKDVFVELLAMREDLPDDPDQIVEYAKKCERDDYENAKRLWEDGTTFEQQEERSPIWLTAFDTLLTRPISVDLNNTPEITAALSIIGNGIEAFGSSLADSWQGLSCYWKWLITLHHEEMVKKYGSLLIVEPTSIPVGMVAVFRNSRTRWEQ